MSDKNNTFDKILQHPILAIAVIVISIVIVSSWLGARIERDILASCDALCDGRDQEVASVTVFAGCECREVE